MKKLAMAFSLSAGILALSACSSEEEAEIVVETEAGDVTKEEFYEAMKEETGETVLQDLVLRTVLEGEYEVTDEEIEAELAELEDVYGAQYVQQTGFASEEELREALSLYLLQEKAVTEDIEVTEEELQAAYERQLTEIEASHILVQDEETAQNLYEEIQDGADFATLAEANSIDTTSAAEGGSLGEFFGAGVMVPEFEEVAFNLEVGEVSEPVQTTHGWHIIKVTDKREVEDVESLEEMEESLRRDIAASKIDQAAAQVKLQELMEAANIDVQIEEFETLFEVETAAAETTEEPAAEEETTEEEATEEPAAE